MSENLELEKQLKLVKKTGSYVVGRREVSSSLKGAKLLVWSASANVPQAMLDDCRSLSVPAIKFAGNPVELGRACGIPFRVSVIALKSTGDADLSAFSKASDYHSGVVIESSKETPNREHPEVKQAREDTEIKPKKVAKKKDATQPPEKKPKKSGAAGEEKKPRKKAETEKPASKEDADTDEAKPKKVATTRKKKKSEEE